MTKYTRPRIFPDGTIAYPKRGWEPPPHMPGYRRKSMNPNSPDAWIFIPEWQDCCYRAERTRRRENCRCLMLEHFCTHPECDGISIDTQICQSCKFRTIR